MQTTDTVLGTPSTMGDDEQLTTTRLLRDAARSFGDQEILYRTDDGTWQRTDYAATWDRVLRMGSALEGLVPPSDHVECVWQSPRSAARIAAIEAAESTGTRCGLLPKRWRISAAPM